MKKMKNRGEIEVKRIMIITVALMIMLAGCSNTKNNADSTNNQATNESTVEDAQDKVDSTDKTDKTQAQNTESTKVNTNLSKAKSEDNTKIQLDKGYHDYEGSINNNLEIKMSLYPSGNEIVGSYFYDKERKELQLKGKLEGNNIVLSEYDENQKNTGTFKGTMDINEKVEGTWISADGKKSYPFILTLTSVLNGSTYGRRYGIAISDNRTDQDVENFINDVQSYIKNDNKEQLSNLVSYPIKAKIDGKYIDVQNKDEFIKNYDKIFNSKYKEIMSTAYTKYLFANYKGIMFGSNLKNMWINDVTPDNGSPKLLITSIIN
jgi:hypothetical protein